MQCGSLIVHYDIKPSNVYWILIWLLILVNLGWLDSFYKAHQFLRKKKQSDIRLLRVNLWEHLQFWNSNRPIDEMFSNDPSLYVFEKMAIPDHVMEISDPVLFKTTQEENLSEDASDYEMYGPAEDCFGLNLSNRDCLLHGTTQRPNRN
ncbi:hypothetical protein OSB04_014085 [Centaurea solstitialis]|uniref:Uncharacterized protein n=1 Tax=Centaurea solstitialis TaxID=347529 RepID=A0AA38TSC7_9ASTR|nr:hypothetical protein OSB04_014085 [Centaurea solstitialis]